jgi:hypothetical protein
MTQVTAIIAVHNGADFIAEAVESALVQTLAGVEVIAIDDGSTDDTPAILERFRPRITVLTHENRGLAAARNGALPHVHSPYVAFLDHDDLWEPPFLERCVGQLATADAGVAGAVTGWTLIDREGRELPGTRRHVRGPIDLTTLVVGTGFAPGQTVLRSEALTAAGGFDATLQGTLDWDLWLRLARAGWSFVTIADCLWRYRRHETNMSGRVGTMRDDGLRTLGKLFADATLPQEIRALQPRALGTVWLHASQQMYAVGDDIEGGRNLAAAAAICPELLGDDETYWAMLCAEQPEGYEASGLYLDLGRAEQRLLGALAACRSAGTLDDLSYRTGLGRGYRALAALAYAQRRMGDVRRYTARALRGDPSLYLDPRTIAPALKSFAGGRVIAAISRWRAHRSSTGPQMERTTE